MESRIRGFERDKSNEHEKNMKKISHFEIEFNRIKEFNEKLQDLNTKLSSINGKNEADVMKLIMENIVLSLENLENVTFLFFYLGEFKI